MPDIINYLIYNQLLHNGQNVINLEF